MDQPLKEEEVIVTAKVTTVDEIVTEINNHESPAAISSAIGKKIGYEDSLKGHLIKPGTIGLIAKNGKIQAVGPGRYLFPHPRASLKKKFSLQDNPIQFETLTIIRVERFDLVFILYRKGKTWICDRQWNSSYFG